jgi:chromosome segregation ATPase
MNTPQERILLDETSRAIGRLEAQGEATARDISGLKEKTEDMDAKLDKLLARTNNFKLTVKHWAVLLAGGSVGGGGLAHALRKLLE